jgi:hypothetical protein
MLLSTYASSTPESPYNTPDRLNRPQTHTIMDTGLSVHKDALQQRPGNTLQHAPAAESPDPDRAENDGYHGCITKPKQNPSSSLIDKRTPIISLDELLSMIPTLMVAMPHVYAAHDADFYVVFFKTKMQNTISDLSVESFATALVPAMTATMKAIEQYSHLATPALRYRQITRFLNLTDKIFASKQYKTGQEVQGIMEEQARFDAKYANIRKKVERWRPWSHVRLVMVIVTFASLITICFDSTGCLSVPPEVEVLGLRMAIAVKNVAELAVDLWTCGSSARCSSLC